MSLKIIKPVEDMAEVGRRVDVNGMKMYYEVSGTGEPLIVLHGLASTLGSLLWVVPNNRKRIALVAHDGQKQSIVDWVRYNKAILVEHEILATGTTGGLVEQVDRHQAVGELGPAQRGWRDLHQGLSGTVRAARATAPEYR